MIVLDTNVLSALMQQQPDSRVIAWLDQQAAAAIWLSSITVFEARYGLDLLAPGGRKELLHQRFDALLREDFQNRVLVFDAAAASHAARLAAQRRAVGRPVDMRDTFIAGIVLAHRATLATRNTRHFQDLPVRVIDPWQESAEP